MRIESSGAAAASTGSPFPTPPASAAVRSPAVAAPPADASKIDPSTGHPVQPKFPWITWLTRELEGAQKTEKSPFAPAGIVGEQVDKTA